MKLTRGGFVVAATLSLGGASSAQQALSKSMIECSVIYTEVAALGQRKGRDEDEISRTRKRALAFLNAALQQAEDEGEADLQNYITETHAELTDKWTDRLSSIVKLRDNKDWLDYCRSFARARGLW